jgi:hypothetical protein
MKGLPQGSDRLDVQLVLLNALLKQHRRANQHILKLNAHQRPVQAEIQHLDKGLNFLPEAVVFSVSAAVIITMEQARNVS